MKLLKKLSFVLAAAAIISCGDDDSSSTPSFELTADSAVGTYALDGIEGTRTTFSVVTETGDRMEFSTTDISGDTFDIDLVLNANGTFDATGDYRSEETTTQNEMTGEPVFNTENLTDSGTYSLDIVNRTITFTNDTASEETIFNGEFAITGISDTSLELEQLSETTSTESTTTYSFTKQ